MFVAYWDGKHIDVYRLKDGKPEKFASGDPEDLKPVKAFGKKVLIVGRGMLFHSRKRYPPASPKDIRKAVDHEVGDLFPLNNPYHFSRIFESTDTYTLVDIWAWDGSGMEKLRSVFPYTHLLPEDMTFVSDSPELTVLGMGETSYIIAHSSKGFLGVSTVKGAVAPEHVRLFSKGIARYAGEIKRLHLLKAEFKSPDLKDFPMEIVPGGREDLPGYLETIGKLELREFAVGSGGPLFTKAGPLLRGMIYLLLAYSLSLYFTGRNYDKGLEETGKALKKLTGEVAVMNSASREDYSGLAGELNRALKAGLTPLELLDLLAGKLPENTFVTRLVLSSGALDITVSALDPLSVVGALSTSERIINPKVKGAPFKEPTGRYSMTFQAELK